MARKPSTVPSTVTATHASTHASPTPEARERFADGWQQIEATEARAEQAARSEALETQALYAAHCDDAANACLYLCKSLGVARQLDAGEPNLELLFELLGALADLPAEVCAAPLPEIVGGDQYGITELCQQLAMAREVSQEAWVDAELAAPTPLHVH